FADAVRRLSRRAAAAICVALSATLFASTMWIGGIIAPSFASGGWSLVRTELVEIFGTRGFAAASGAVVLMIGLLLALARGQSRSPAWVFDGPIAASWPMPRLRPGIRATLWSAVTA